MKTIAFLCTLLVAILVTPKTLAYQKTSHEILNSTITTSSHVGNLTIISEGEITFNTNVQTGDLRYQVNNLTHHEGIISVYGFTHSKLREHKAFIVFLDLLGNVVRNDIFEETPLLEVVEHYGLEDSIVFRLRESIDDDGYKEIRNHFIRYDESLTTYQSEMIDSPLKVIDIVDDKLVMKPTYHHPYTYGLDADLNQYEPHTVYGAKDKESFIGSVTLFTLNEATIGGEPFTHHYNITYPGYHHIKVGSKEMTITVHPELTTIENNQTYEAPLTIDVSKGRLLLNGGLISSNEMISDPGHYTLIIEGLNGYEMRVDFTVLSSVAGVFNNQVYDSKRTLTFNGVGYLNNTFIETGYIVNEPGIYTLDILGENDYRETLQFEIRDSEQASTKNTLLYIEIGLLATIIVSAATLLIKGKLKS